MKVHVKGSSTLFKSKFLEALTRTHPAIILSMYIPICGFLLYYFYTSIDHSFTALLLLFFGGMFSWTFFEYILHRHVFHFIDERRWTQRFHFFVHGIHHEYPKDKNRLVLPPLPSLIVASVFFLFFRLIVGVYAYAFFSGFMIGYLTYAMMHYTMHMVRPPKTVFKYLWVHHNHHHYKYPDKAFGVSSPFWDIIFGTMPPKKEKSESKPSEVISSKI